MRVLIVDDERHVLKGLRSSIDWHGLGFNAVDLAENGVQALLRFSEHRPDIVITDVYMPRMNGIQLIHKIREVDDTVPLVILSGYDDFSFAQQALQMNVSRYLLKPCVPADIIREVQDVLAETQQKRQQLELLTKMHDQIESSLPILRENYLYQMITVGMEHRELTAERIAFYRLNSCIGKFLCVLSIKTSSPEMTGYNEYSVQLLKGAVLEQVRIVIGACDDVYVLRYIEDRIPLIVCADSEVAVVTRAKDLSVSIIKHLNSVLQVDVVVGIGRPAAKTEHFPTSFDESIKALAVCEAVDSNTFLVYEDEQSDTISRWLHYPQRLLRRLIDALICLNEQEVMNSWQEIEESLLLNKPVHPSILQFMCVSILGNVITRLTESGNPILDPEGIAYVFDSIQQQHTTKALMEVMRKNLDIMLRKLQAFAMESSESPHVAKVKRIVAQHYHEQILFGRLAHEMNISRNYLSMMFKKETGVSFMNYLTSFRISKAKELLLQKRYMVYEIAQMVGYQDAAYFSRMFKNSTGCTPLEFIMHAEQAPST